MNKSILAILSIFIGLAIPMSGQLSIGLSGGGSLSSYKTTNFTALPDLSFRNNDSDVGIFENIEIRLDANVFYKFKNKLVLGIHGGRTSFNYNYSFVSEKHSSTAGVGVGLDNLFHAYSTLGLRFENKRWSYQPFLGIGRRWYPKNSYIDPESKLVTRDIGEFDFNSNIDFSFTGNSYNFEGSSYIFPQFFLPIGMDIWYSIAENLRFVTRVDYEFGFNERYFKGVVTYYDTQFPSNQGLSIFEKNNIFSLNAGLNYTFEKSSFTKKTRKTLKNRQL